MLKWLLALAIAVLVAGVFLPRLAAWLGFRRLPGDLTVRWRGREYQFPFTSALLFSLLAFLVLRLF